LHILIAYIQNFILKHATQMIIKTVKIAILYRRDTKTSISHKTVKFLQVFQGIFLPYYILKNSTSLV